MSHGAFTSTLCYSKLQNPLEVLQVLFRGEADVSLPYFHCAKSICTSCALKISAEQAAGDTFFACAFKLFLQPMFTPKQSFSPPWGYY